VTATAVAQPSVALEVRRWLSLAMVAVLPLHTVFVRGWIAWKPFLVVLVIVVGIDVADGLRRRRWPWDPWVSGAAAVFLATVGAGWFVSGFHGRFLRLSLALGVGIAVMLVVARTIEEPGMSDRVLRVVFWSAAVLGVTGFVLAIVAVGGVGASAIETVDGLPLVARVFKPAYLTEGFVAVTNWHQDPGYAAAWTNLWASLAVVAAARGRGSRRWWLDGAVVGSLAVATFMTMSRTGWMGFAVAMAITSVVLVVKDRVPAGRIGRVAIAAAGVAVVMVGFLAAVDRVGVGADLATEVAFRLDQNVSLDAGDAGGLGADLGEVDTRRVVWPWYVEAFRTHPILGIGLGTGWALEGVQEPHNLGLELLGETGIVGFVGFALLAGTVVRRGRGTLGAIALAVALVAAFTQTVLFEPTLWFAAGLYIGGRGSMSAHRHDLEDPIDRGSDRLPTPGE